MSYPSSQLLCGDRARHRGIHIADHDNQVWPFSQTNFLKRHHDPGSLLCMGARTDLKIDIGFRHTEIDKERIAHAFVVMLAGVNENVLNPSGIPVHRLDNWRHFHEIRTRTDYIENFHGGYLALTRKKKSKKNLDDAKTAVPKPRVAFTRDSGRLGNQIGAESNNQGAHHPIKSHILIKKKPAEQHCQYEAEPREREHQAQVGL